VSPASSEHKDKLKGLYAITDENLIAEESFSEAIESALLGGARIIQYRDKSANQKKRLLQASVLRTLCTQYQATCIINDDISLAKSVNADGVHLGKNDTELLNARQILGENAIIGISCYNDIDLAIDAEKNSADYVACHSRDDLTSKTATQHTCLCYRRYNRRQYRATNTAQHRHGSSHQQPVCYWRYQKHCE
jgi:thiamine-phosphate diphosphorylase